MNKTIGCILENIPIRLNSYIILSQNKINPHSSEGPLLEKSFWFAFIWLIPTKQQCQNRIHIYEFFFCQMYVYQSDDVIKATVIVMCEPCPYCQALYNTVYSIHYIVYSLQYTVYYILYTVLSIMCTVYSKHYTNYSIQHSVYSIQYTVYCIHYTLYSIQCT